MITMQFNIIKIQLQYIDDMITIQFNNYNTMQYNYNVIWIQYNYNLIQLQYDYNMI